MTVTMLIQIDKLVQLLESPVFTYLRLQLLEPSLHPHLYKTLYGILMLLPQSAAFAALKNRLNSVSAIGYLHIPNLPPPSSLQSLQNTNQTYHPSSAAATANAGSATTPQTSLRGQVAPGTAGVVSVAVPAFERANRLKPRDDSSASSGPGATNPAGAGVVKWGELLDKFRQAQDRARRVGRAGFGSDGMHDEGERVGRTGGVVTFGLRPGSAAGSMSGRASAAGGSGGGAAAEQAKEAAAQGAAHGHRSKFSASQLGRFASGVGRRNTTGKK